MARYRGKADIIADVLSATGSGAKKTKIMYGANLSYRLMQKYLAEVVGLGFIFFNDKGYEVTEKGRAFLGRHKVFSDKYSKIEVELSRLLREKQDLERLCRREENCDQKPLERRQPA